MSPSGSDGGTGAIGDPWATFEHASGVLTAGDTLYVRGGTYTSAQALSYQYRFQISGLAGTSSNWITITRYQNEVPVFDCSGSTPTADPVFGLDIANCSYLRMFGIRVTGITQRSSPSANSVYGLQLENSNNCIMEFLESDNMGGYGISNYLSTDVLWLNCDAHHCADPVSGYGGANGFNITGDTTSTRVTFQNCRAWLCSDDGFDFYGADGIITLDGCWAFKNGFDPASPSTPVGDGIGFKLGPHTNDQAANGVRRYVQRCLAFENYNDGMSQNSARMQCQIYNNTFYNNGRYGLTFIWHTDVAQVCKNNIAYQNPSGNADGSPIQGSYNSWNGSVTVTDGDFQSISSTGADGSRGTDGSLPTLSYMRLDSGSDLIGAGTYVGLPYTNSGPDMGAFQTDQIPSLLAWNEIIVF